MGHGFVGASLLLQTTTHHLVGASLLANSIIREQARSYKVKMEFASKLAPTR
jgi:hypothetical protein